ncbi:MULTISPECIES: bactofilin family protein [Dysgonomonas]|uniref:bactofilin family protein n=1 Tax=Dysgonomonas TaxID=156973 RepID=UPI00092C6E41|nr:MULTISPECIES: polymer-forming cytoskeletal protein [Dysgonomonas]MBN9302688.1 polymer-forming cytoskeletal protein [Dysgonomonas mossii]OJX58786.1 MAG: hypothetical protein BGO84_02125 [Dysgonomonas sp. 37-18]
MIKKQTQRDDQPDDLTSLMPTVICKSFTLRGNIKQTRAIRIEGTIIGNIEQAETVVIGMTGTIRGNVNTKKLIVFGHIEGDISASESVLIKCSGQITGRLNTENLSMDEGGIYEGEIIMKPSSL